MLYDTPQKREMSGLSQFCHFAKAALEEGLTACCFCFTPLIILKKCIWHLPTLSDYKSSSFNWSISNWAKGFTPIMAIGLSITVNRICGTMFTQTTCVPSSKKSEKSMCCYITLFISGSSFSILFSAIICWLVFQQRLKVQIETVQLKHKEVSSLTCASEKVKFTVASGLRTLPGRCELMQCDEWQAQEKHTV